jgi:dolichol kinase
VNGALKAAWGLTAFVIVAGVVGWIVTGRPVFAVFVVLGVLTGAGAAFALRPAPDRPGRKEGPTS